MGTGRTWERQKARNGMLLSLHMITLKLIALCFYSTNYPHRNPKKRKKNLRNRDDVNTVKDTKNETFRDLSITSDMLGLR